MLKPSLALAIALLLAGPAFAQAPAAEAPAAAKARAAKPVIVPFSDPDDINLLSILPPPPENGSPEMQRELGEVLSIQVTRTPEQVNRAAADVEENIWRFSDVVDNASFTPERLPKVDAFFKRVFRSEGRATDPVKKFYSRPRPFQYSDLVKPAITLSLSGAYPSGHTTSATLAAIVLSNMLPEKRRAIMSRAWEYAWNRVIGGMHFRSDIEAGHIAGAAIYENIKDHADFKAEFAEARSELRAALGMGM